MNNRSGCINVLGLGVGEMDLPQAYLEIINQAELIAGGRRLLKRFANYKTSILRIEPPLSQVLDAIRQALAEGKNVAVLTDGDPLFYGFGQTLLKEFGSEYVYIYPNLTVLQQAASRLKLPWADLKTISLHGRRDFQPLLKAISEHGNVAVYTDQTCGPREIASLLYDLAPNRFRMHVLENLGTSQEKVHSLQIEQVKDLTFASLNFVVIETIKQPSVHARIGLPDESYVQQKGMLTKKEIRLAVLGELQINKDHTVWDLGAGSGSVAVEASLLARDGQVLAVEKDKQRANQIIENIVNTGRYFIQIVPESMPEALAKLPDPDRIFIGGGIKQEDSILDICWARLRPKGRMVISLVLLGTLNKVIQFCKDKGVEFNITHFQISRSRPLNQDKRFMPLNPVYILTLNKKDR